MTLKLLQGGEQPKAHSAKKGEAEQWVCRTCEAETSVATSAIVSIKQNPMIRNGKLEGGEMFHACLHCLLRGTLTKV